MLNSIFNGLFDNAYTQVIPVGTFLLCVGCALVLGAVLAALTGLTSRSSKGFLATLALLPAVVAVVIMTVNGNVGTGVAVAGAFSLVRFRSAQGSAKEIGALFLAMAVGLLIGMGYVGYAVLTAFLLGGASVLLGKLSFNDERLTRTLRIVIPEDINYTDVFRPVFDQYTTKTELIRVKTTNMGSLYSLTYELTLKNAEEEKEMIDALRCRNGNLEISMSRQEHASGEL